MPKCFKCNGRIEDGRSFRSHLRTHGYDRNTPVVCAEDICPSSIRVMSNTSSLMRHYTEVHGFSLRGTGRLTDEVLIGNEMEEDVADGENVELDDPDSSDIPDDLRTDDSDTFSALLVNELDLLIAKLYQNQRVPRNLVDDVVEYVYSLLDRVSTGLKPLFLKLLNKLGPDGEEERCEIEKYLSILQCPSIELKTEQRRLTKYEREGTYIKPEKILITTQVGASNSASHGAKMQTFEAMFIPLRKQLTQFLQQPEVMRNVLPFIEDVLNETEFYVNYMNADRWKNFNFEGKFMLPLCLFSDSVENGNSLGSRKSIHKTTNLYVSMPFLPREIYSGLRNILVVFLHHSQDAAIASNDKLYKRVIDEFIHLFHVGIYIETPEYSGKIYFILALMLGDNLGIHEMLDFSGSFSANYPCHICIIYREVMLRSCREDRSLLRNPQNYASHLEINDLSRTGIAAPCAWHRVPLFHCTLNTAVDLMHDFFEGICVFVFIVIILYCFDCGFFDLDTLNERILMFQYGPIDVSNKPPTVKLDKGSLIISMSAAEMKVFTKYFGLLVGDLVPENNFVWHLYVLLKRILDILLSPAIPKDRIDLLSDLIEEFLSLYLRLCKDGRLKNKCHHLTHYPYLITQVGPPIFYWCILFEAKNCFEKSIALAISSRKNLTESIAIRTQMAFHAHLKMNSFPNKKLRCGVPCTQVKIWDIDGYELFRDQVPLNVRDVETVEWIESKGTIFSNNMVVVTGYSDDFDLPQFSLIKNILVLNSQKVVFICLKLETMYFDSHYQAYEISSSENVMQYIEFSNLVHSFPTAISCSSLGDLFVLYKHGI